MPGVEDAQVVGVPDAKYGEVVGAFIRLKAGADVTEDDVQEFCRARMARYKAPKYVFFVDEYPMTASGQDPEVQAARHGRRDARPVRREGVRERGKRRVGVGEGRTTDVAFPVATRRVIR